MRVGGARRLGFLPRGEGTEVPWLSLTLEVLRLWGTHLSPRKFVGN